MSQSGLRILFTNNTLAYRAGTELYVRDLALALMKRGHYPMAYSTRLGDVAAELSRATVPVVGDLAALNVPPDIVHGHHHLETMTAAMRFPETPAVFVCHGWQPFEESPPLFPTIRRYIAVDDLCRERLLTKPNLDASLVDTIYNFVDVERFQRRGGLPASPKSALVFSNSASGHMVKAIRAACRGFGIARLDIVGASSGNVASEPETILGGYDVVFAKARAALEAMASGCAVVVADAAGLGGMVTSENVARLQRLNFGVRTMQAATVSEANVFEQLKRYDSVDASKVTDHIRTTADISLAVDRWEAVYAQGLADWRVFCDAEGTSLHKAQLAAASEYLAFLAPVLKKVGHARPPSPPSLSGPTRR